MDGRVGDGRAGNDGGGTITCLYVDDDEALLSLTEDYMESQYDRFVIETARDAEQGLAMLEARSFDAVISDYQMPGMDGLEFLRTVREERDDDDVSFVIFTGQGREALAMEALNLGADRYLQKGGDPTSQYGVLARAIKQEVGYHRTDRRLREREEHLRITLESIGEAVVATDAEGRVERMNGVAERLTGWDRADAAGRPLSEVFEIYDQETGGPATNPVEEVLASGETVALANGTRLSPGTAPSGTSATAPRPSSGRTARYRASCSSSATSASGTGHGDTSSASSARSSTSRRTRWSSTATSRPPAAASPSGRPTSLT